MLPCGRGTLLAKSAGFKKIPKDIQIKHEKHTKSIQISYKIPFEIHLKNYAGKYFKRFQKYYQHCDFGFPFWRLLHDVFPG